MKNKIHIVGLRYYSWCGRMDELFAPDAPANDKWMLQEPFGRLVVCARLSQHLFSTTKTVIC